MSPPNAPIASVRRIADIANQLAHGPQNAQELVAELFRHFAEVLRKDDPTVQPIETAPHVRGQKLLLFCPKQDGWQVGQWAEDRWLSTWRVEFLDPTHWAGLPPDPDA